MDQLNRTDLGRRSGLVSNEVNVIAPFVDEGLPRHKPSRRTERGIIQGNFAREDRHKAHAWVGVPAAGSRRSDGDTRDDQIHPVLGMYPQIYAVGLDLRIERVENALPLHRSYKPR